LGFAVLSAGLAIAALNEPEEEEDDDEEEEELVSGELSAVSEEGE
jgi:hypothetical protein